MEAKGLETRVDDIQRLWNGVFHCVTQHFNHRLFMLYDMKQNVVFSQNIEIVIGISLLCESLLWLE